MNTDKYKKRFRFTVIFLGLFILAVIIIKITLHPVFVIGSSMYPTYESGDLLITKTSFDRSNVNRGKVIVFNHNGKTYIKRVVALPGETVEVRADGVYINGTLFEDKPTKITCSSTTLGDDEYFAIGDNRDNSSDCRAFGPIKFKEITNIVR